MLVNLAGGSLWSYWGKILAGASKVLIGVNLVQLAQPFDRDTRWSSSVVVVSYSAVCKDIIMWVIPYQFTEVSHVTLSELGETWWVGSPSELM